MEKENILTDKEQEEYKRLTGLEKLGSLMGKELPERSQQRLDELRKRLGENMIAFEDAREVPQELRDFREAWKEKIEGIYPDTKQKIIETVETIPVRVETDNDGSRLIEFKLGNKTYKILDPIIKSHTDKEYKVDAPYVGIMEEKKSGVSQLGMIGDDIYERDNEELRKYVAQKKQKGLDIPEAEEMEKLLGELGRHTGITGLGNEISMLMYLTGMDGGYFLKSDKNKKSRFCMYCFDKTRGLSASSDKSRHANLCMMSHS